MQRILTEIFGWPKWVQHMGLRYCIFRFWYALQRKTGILRSRFPTVATEKTFISTEDWRALPVYFFFDKNPAPPPDPFKTALRRSQQHIAAGTFPYFSKHWHRVDGWHTHPLNGYTFEKSMHWTRFHDFSEIQGDIKWIWEKSRFCFLYDLIRYDHHFQDDQSTLVLSLMLNWISENPVNCGPNWMCSQEISLRVLNWTFALFYYRHFPHWTQNTFDTITCSIYDQMRHVAENISFSRIAVRNNHALTETAALFVTGLLFPFFPESSQWKADGLKWFAQEIDFQIDENGAYVQHSMNYHRVVVQLITWVIRLARLHAVPLPDIIYQKAMRVLHFLQCSQDPVSGWLPNYGPQDGALFFPLTRCHFRDFRPQLGALEILLTDKCSYAAGDWQEEAHWLGLPQLKFHSISTLSRFSGSGYVAVKSKNTLTWLRCGAYKHRPHQADNLHLDLWINGKNVLRDPGTFAYQGDMHWVKYFAETGAHNTIMVGQLDQMLKKSRFIWLHWVRDANIFIKFSDKKTVLEGSFRGFRQCGQWITHKRKVTILTRSRLWIAEDFLENVPDGYLMSQIWNPCTDFDQHFQMNAFDENGSLSKNVAEGWFSEFYGEKVLAPRIVFQTYGTYIKTIIAHKHAHSARPPIFSARRRRRRHALERNGAHLDAGGAPGDGNHG